MFHAQSTITVISGRSTFDRYILRKKGEVKGGDSAGGEGVDSEGDNEGREIGGGGCEGRTESDSKVGYIMGKRQAEAEAEGERRERQRQRDLAEDGS